MLCKTALSARQMMLDDAIRYLNSCLDHADHDTRDVDRTLYERYDPVNLG